MKAVVETADELRRGREAYASRAWLDAYTALSEADRIAPLEAGDLDLFANSASLVGRTDEYLTLLERAHLAHIEDGDNLAAAGSAGWLGMTLAIQGEIGPASGWFGRAHRLVEREGRDCVERGWLLIPLVFQHEAAGDYEGAFEAAAGAVEFAERFDDRDLAAIALHAQGMTRIWQGSVDEGLRLLDEAMAGVTADLVSPIVAGIVYCGVIAGCEAAFELRRAQEWTSALTRWCEGQPQLVAFTGRCLAHRAGLMQFHGKWRDALEEAELARQRCEEAMNLAATGQALYQQGEVHRLQGGFEQAEAAYRDASGYGREPQPGLALLRLAQRDPEAAAGMSRRAVGEAVDQPARASVLPAHVEIMLAVDDLDEARRAAEELDEIAARRQASDARGDRGLRARVRSSSPKATLRPHSRRSVTRVGRGRSSTRRTRSRGRASLIGLACERLGDQESAELELDAAREVFERLGAAPDLARLGSLTAPAPHGLSARELEVLRHVAAGKTNREIAAELVVSEHTVARHLQNIFSKLGVSSRTAATAFAFEHHLV